MSRAPREEGKPSSFVQWWTLHGHKFASPLEAASAAWEATRPNAEHRERTLGMRLSDERKRMGLTQEAFAAACGVHRRTQVNYEADKILPNSKYIAAAHAIGVDLEYLGLKLPCAKS